MRDKKFKKAHETVKMKFPMLQGTSTHSLFREIGKLSSDKVGLGTIKRIFEEEGRS